MQEDKYEKVGGKEKKKMKYDPRQAIRDEKEKKREEKKELDGVFDKEDEEEIEKSSSKPSLKKTFLKRKNQSPKFQKLNWKAVGSKIDCWNAAKTIQSGVILRPPPSNKYKKPVKSA